MRPSTLSVRQIVRTDSSRNVVINAMLSFVVRWLPCNQVSCPLSFCNGRCSCLNRGGLGLGLSIKINNVPKVDQFAPPSGWPTAIKTYGINRRKPQRTNPPENGAKVGFGGAAVCGGKAQHPVHTRGRCLVSARAKQVSRHVPEISMVQIYKLMGGEASLHQLISCLPRNKIAATVLKGGGGGLRPAFAPAELNRKSPQRNRLPPPLLPSIDTGKGATGMKTKNKNAERGNQLVYGGSCTTYSKKYLIYTA